MSTLSGEERALWHAWKTASESVMERVAADLSRAEVSAGDYAVLSRLVELGKGELTQRALGESMRWEKTRLSHHVSRMEARGLVARTSAGRSVMVSITAPGRALLRIAKPIHARAVREHLVARLSERERAELTKLLAKLTTP